MDKLLRVEVPTATLKDADSMVEAAFKASDEMIDKGITFEFKCGKCDEMHEGGLNKTVIAALFKANIDYYIEQTFPEDHIPLIDLYAAIFRHLYANKTANAELLSEELEVQLQSQFEKDMRDHNLKIPADAVAGLMMLQIEKWNDATTD